MTRLTRRQLLALALGIVLTPRRAGAVPETRQGSFSADVGILYGVLSFHLAGTIEETIDRAAGRYAVKIRGQGSDISNSVDTEGILHEGRWAPVLTRSRSLVHGRETRLDMAYDHARRLVDYKSRSETFFLRRVRAAEDTVALPPGTHVDDVMSATLNYAEQRWPPEADGTFRTHVVRRHRPKGEGADEVQKRYHAELVPFVLRIAPDAGSGQPTALFDMTRFSSWALEDRPARIVFGPHRRPESITTSLMLGTSVAIRITAPA
jgi:hypothetical protein